MILFNRFKISPLLLTILLILPGHLHGQENGELKANLIAHRGGVVDEHRAENSASAIKEAIKRGYRMLEVDLRKSRDGRIVVHHDPTFESDYGYSGAVAEMDWSEIKELRSKKDGHRPLLFEEVAKLAEGQVGLMLDVKGNDYGKDYYQKIEQILVRFNLLLDTFILSGSEAQSYFKNKASLSAGFDKLIEQSKKGVDVKNLYHLFELGSNLDHAMIEKANELGVTVVAAINVFRYRQADEDVWDAARDDIERLMDLGISYFQVDSFYEPLFYSK
ncbi:glycerophosphodiester phosphodiesterase [Rhodohalobacter sulfatireducens]|uniref:Glycerophosphodiester phosphodiesterase family protein n=1 Tax=Rhodohalobacter sulfatireducens TaxID=2911366 RepID=A0ABS9KH22_9BACT|nr:glycerophosphodiester phosphodiesterase family protein [Rhodohalobacter sulfatireducens]MCG2590146.1 glycerophosphodiester phosphodiesterase family protein [Rhodohalobacter sulfatireducens]